MIPPAGRMVRCGKCTNQWFVAHPDPLAAEQAPVPTDVEIKPLAKGANVPALKKRDISPRPFKIAAPVIVLVWLVLAFCTYFPHWVESPLGSVYRMFGVETTEGLVFSDVTMEREQGEGSKVKFIISGSVRNHASVTRTVPTVRVLLKNKQGKDVWSREYPVKAPLKAGDIYPFRITNVETSFAGSVTSIVLDLGHPLELMMR